MIFYIPSWYGDFRLVGEGGQSKLILNDLTDHERIIVANFLRSCKKKGWYADDVPAPKSPYRGNAKAIVYVDAPLEKVSKILIRLSRPKDRTLNAVKFASGKMEIVEGATSEAMDKLEGVVVEASKEKGSKGTSIKRPTPSCPTCEVGAIAPASEVLLSFLDEKQHRDWAQNRAIMIQGGFSGHRYVLAHRKSELAAEIGKICFDLDDELVIHFHDTGMPPEEEVLAAKLILEHREPWLRNEATCLGGPATDIYKNPFGDGMDGVESASFSAGFGEAMSKLLS